MIYQIAKNHLIKQMRSYSFLIIISISLFLGYACVPAMSDGYQIFYIGGVRGIYNSAWLGGMVTMLSSLLVWLFGFYMLRSQISDDQRLKVGQIIASTPISNLRYISTKAISNFVVLVVIDLIFMVAFMAMQLFRGEDYHLNIWDYVAPFSFITLPSMLVLAALTILFDVLPGFKGAVGNLVFFALWVFFSVISIAAPNSMWDLFGLDSILSDMVREAQIHFPYLVNSAQGGSFGYYPTNGNIPTFVWHGVDWNSTLLASRSIWVSAAAILIIIASLLFNRFRESSTRYASANAVSIFNAKGNSSYIPQQNKSFKLSTVQKNKGMRLIRCVIAEIHLMLKDMSLWWRLIAAAVIACSFFLPLQIIRNWLPVLMLLPIAIWSQMGTRDKYYFTKEIIASSCSPIFRWLEVWIAGIVITLLISVGVLLHFIQAAQWQAAGSWAVGVLFVPTLGMVLGSLSGSRKLFEVIYLLWWYMGPFNKIPYLDFLGISTYHAELYLGMSVGLLLIAVVGHIKLFIHIKQKRRILT
ncbi:hypothetical protein [Desulfosporosinus fructosivorans]